jgi:hypothetical protein
VAKLTGLRANELYREAMREGEVVRTEQTSTR